MARAILIRTKNVIRYRPFLNSDPPAIAEIWRNAAPMRGCVQSITPSDFDHMVLSKPYFDRHGLILALDGERPVGFVHAGFGPSDDMSRVSHERGVTCILLVASDADVATIERGLLQHSEEYLTSRGARELYGGSARPLNPFYLGLYGGSELPGILASDTRRCDLFQLMGYEAVRRRAVMQRRLTGYRPPIDRRMMLVRRNYEIDVDLDPRSSSWWEASTLGQTDRTKIMLTRRGDRSPSAAITVWDMEPLASSWGVHAMGLTDLEVDEEVRRQGLATFLLGEALRQLHKHGVMLVEAQVDRDNEGMLDLLKKLDFKEIDEGICFCKQ